MLVSIASTDTYTHTEREGGSKRSLIADNPEVIRGTLQEIEKTEWASATIAVGPNTNIFIWGAVIDAP